MLFKLQEAIDSALIKKWDNKKYNLPNHPANRELVDRVFQEIGDPEVLRQDDKVEAAVFKNLNDFGIDPDVNPFVTVFGGWGKEFKGVKNLGKYIDILNELHRKNEVISPTGVDLPHLQNVSLYKRNEPDFKYTVRLFRILNDVDGAAKKFFRNTKVIKLPELYVGNKYDGKIKPVGHPQKDSYNEDTLIGVINKWSEGNDAGGPRKDSGKYSIQHILANHGINKEDAPKYFTKLITDETTKLLLQRMLYARKALVDEELIPKLLTAYSVTTPLELPSNADVGAWGVAKYPSTHPYETQVDEPNTTHWVKTTDGWYKMESNDFVDALKALASQGQSFLQRKISDDEDVTDDELVELVTKELKERDVEGIFRKLQRDAHSGGIEAKNFAEDAYKKAEARSRYKQRGK